MHSLAAPSCHNSASDGLIQDARMSLLVTFGHYNPLIPNGLIVLFSAFKVQLLPFNPSVPEAHYKFSEHRDEISSFTN